MKGEARVRPHTIQNAEIPNPTLGTAERFRRFVRGIVSVPKTEADKEVERLRKGDKDQVGLAKRRRR